MANKDKTLGALIAAIRRQNDWTLREMSTRVGIPLSTLAKVEANKLSLTYDKLQQLSTRLGMTMAEFMAATPDEPGGGAKVTARRSVMGQGNSLHVITKNYDYEYLCTDIRGKQIIPIITTVRTGDIDAFGELVRHHGEEFIYVLDGAIEVHSEFYAPVVLRQGEGIYLDSNMGHAYVAKDCDSAVVLAMCTSEEPPRQSGEGDQTAASVPA